MYKLVYARDLSAPILKDIDNGPILMGTLRSLAYYTFVLVQTHKGDWLRDLR